MCLTIFKFYAPKITYRLVIYLRHISAAIFNRILRQNIKLVNKGSKIVKIKKIGVFRGASDEIKRCFMGNGSSNFV